MAQPARKQSSAFNVQVWIDGADNVNALGRYRFLLSASDADGKIIRSINNARWSDTQAVNELGEVAFPRVSLDPRGGMISVRATLLFPGSQVDTRQGFLVELMAFARYSSSGGSRLVFKLVPTLENETDTDNPPKTTAGVDGKVTAGPVEVGGKYERESGDRTIARSFGGKVKSMALMPMGK